MAWVARMIRDVLWLGVANRSMGLSIAILLLLVLGIVSIGAQISAPFIYTLF